jgi:NAD(P)H-nitrite reductase large subunit
VVRIEAGARLLVSDAEGVRPLTARRVVLATGVRESSRAARLIGGDRPQGVLSTGALQSLVYLKSMRPFLRPVILGTELVSFSAILTCRHIGARPVAMVEPNARITARAFARGLPWLLGMPVHLNTEIAGIHGKAGVEGVTLADADGQTRDLACDGVVVSGGFVPEASLLRAAGLEVDPLSGGPAVDQLGRCSDPCVFATGNLLRPVETAGWSWREGIETGRVVAEDLAGRLPAAEATARLRVEGGALRYVAPQRLSLPGGESIGAVQLRLAHPAAGRLIATCDGRTVYERRLDSRPERRILAPLAPLLAAARNGGDIRFRMEERG